MSLLLPVSTDPLNSPDHSFLHRVIAIDSAATEQSILVTTGGRVGIGGATNTSNILLITANSYTGGLMVTGSNSGGTGFGMENTVSGGNRYYLVVGGASNDIGAGAYGIYDYTGGHYRLTIKPSTGNIGLTDIVNPTACLHLPAGTATASSAPLKFTSGTLLTTPEAGAMEFLSNAFYLTVSTGAVRQQITTSVNTLTLTNKTQGDELRMTQITTPSNPSAGLNKLYFKSDNLLYGLTSAGTETAFVDVSTAQTITNKTIAGGSNTISGITETMLSTSDITTLNVSTTKHGFAPKAPNDATKYLDGTGAYSVPPSGTSNTAVDPNTNGWMSYSTDWIVYNDSGTVKAFNFYPSTALNTSSFCYGGQSTIKVGGAGYVFKRFTGNRLQTVATSEQIRFTDIKRIMIKSVHQFSSVANTTGFGFYSAYTTDVYVAKGTTTVNRAVFLYDTATSKLWAITCDGSAETATDLSGLSLTLTQYHEYKIDYDKENTSVKFYIDGTLQATHTTNISTSTNEAVVGYGLSGGTAYVNISPLEVSQKIA